MKKVFTDIRIECSVCGHKLSEVEADRKHCPYCKNNLTTIAYFENKLIGGIKNDKNVNDNL